MLKCEFASRPRAPRGQTFQILLGRWTHSSLIPLGDTSIVAEETLTATGLRPYFIIISLRLFLRLNLDHEVRYPKRLWHNIVLFAH